MKKLLICCITLSMTQPCVSMDKKKEVENLSLQLNQQNSREKQKQLEKLKTYINHIENSLPPDISCKITEIWLGTLMRTEAIKNKHTLHTFLTSQKCHNITKPQLIVSPNGDYFIHNIGEHFISYGFDVCNTQNNTIEYQFTTNHRIPAFFSPHNNYIITRESDGVCLYDIKNHQKHLLLDRKEASCDIIMSSNGTYVLNQGRHPLKESFAFYTLWELDQANKPKKIPLKNNLIGSYSVLFHPNNKQMYHTKGNLLLYDIATQQEIALTDPQPDAHECLSHDLRFTPDKTHMICDVWINDAEQFIERHALLNIQNHENVTKIVIPAASLAQETYLTPLCTASSHMVIHVCNKGKTLQLLDENMELIASYNTTENSYITALATNRTGDYLASGYSDGAIIVLDISNPRKAIRDKELIGSQGSIKKLTFTDNHLLLSQAKSNKTSGTAILWDIQGNQVINFGNSVVTSRISENGKKIAIISEDISLGKKYLTVTCYNLDVLVDKYTLTEGYNLFKKYNP